MKKINYYELCMDNGKEIYKMFPGYLETFHDTVTNQHINIVFRYCNLRKTGKLGWKTTHLETGFLCYEFPGLTKKEALIECSKKVHTVAVQLDTFSHSFQRYIDKLENYKKELMENEAV